MFGHKSYKPSVDKASSIAENFLNFQKKMKKIIVFSSKTKKRNVSA